MFKKTVEFDDLDGNPVKETFHFNFHKIEIIEMVHIEHLEEKLQRLGISAQVKELTDPENTKEAYEIFKDLILKAYGKKAADNRGFEKKDPVTGRVYRYELEASPALSEIVIEMIQNPDLGSEFVESCLPARMVAEAKAEIAKENPTNEEVTELVQVAGERQANPETAMAPSKKTFNEYTEKELLEMSDAEFKRVVPVHDPKSMTQDQLRIAFQRKNQ